MNCPTLAEDLQGSKSRNQSKSTGEY